MREFIRGGLFIAEGENKKHCSECPFFGWSGEEIFMCWCDFALGMENRMGRAHGETRAEYEGLLDTQPTLDWTS
jgi:hypothetical protein